MVKAETLILIEELVRNYSNEALVKARLENLIGGLDQEHIDAIRYIGKYDSLDNHRKEKGQWQETDIKTTRR